MPAKAKEPSIADYKYVDAWHTDENGKNSPWTRLELSKIAAYQQNAAFNFNCFCTVQRFATEDRKKGEAFLAPLYFDLDYSENPAVSQADAIKLVKFFTEELELQLSDIWIYFSGSKGFHVLVNSQALGIQPRNDLHKIFKHIAGYLIHRLELISLDLVVYTSSRMLRLPNSIHQNTRLFKIELSFDELQTLTLAEIKALAGQPRRTPVFSREQRMDGLELRPKAGALFTNKLAEFEEVAVTSSARYEKEEYRFTKGQPPACVNDILTNGWKKPGDRNQATVQLACYFKDAGHTREEALAILEPWVTKFTSADKKYDVQQRIANTRSVVDAIYSLDNEYRFGCAFIRSLHGPKVTGSKEYDRVACTGDMCPCTGKGTAAEDETEAVDLHLSKTADAALYGKLVRTKVMVAGRKHTPYIVPRKIEYSCWGHKGCKRLHCPLHDIPTHTHYMTLGHANRELIQMTATNDDNVKGILREASGIPSCPKYDMEVVETTNVDEILVIPMASNAEDDKQGEYVLRKVYSIGGLQVAENKYYDLTGYVFSHPKNQESTLMVKSAVPLQDAVESFEITEEVKESLGVFQPQDYTVEAIAEKIAAICNDFTYNVTKIVERDEPLLALLLVQHSILRFSVPWASDPIRGWVEAFLLGDTGTGKSELVNSLMKYAGLGARVNAESTSRTGLTYKMEQSGGSGAWYIIWGAWPLADREMIWIDEATSISKDDYGEMTLARSDGRLEVKRAVTAETPCRVRAILSGNVKGGKRLTNYTHGVEALKDIFNNEDIRRFDLAVCLRAGDVDAEKYNQKLPTFPRMVDAETYKNNILFAWSRRPEDVVFAGGTIDKILEVATALSKVYGNANDIPLVSPSDQRNKVARLAVALAALTHSVDESGERIVVWPGHVDFIHTFLKGVYNAESCSLNYYAKLANKEEKIGQDKFKRITQELQKVDTLKGETKYKDFVNLFAKHRYIRQGEIENMLCIDREEVREVVGQLSRLNMLEGTSGGFRKTPRFNAYISYAMQIGLLDDLNDDI
jgi:hypothetical protein